MVSTSESATSDMSAKVAASGAENAGDAKVNSSDGLVHADRDQETVESALIDRAGGGPGIGRLMLAGIALVLIMGLFVFLPPEYSQQVSILVMLVLSVMGIIFIFSIAIGFVHLSSTSRADAFARAFLDGLSRGAIVTDWEGRIVYANRAYGDLTGSASERDVSTIERVFSHAEDASEIVYQMNQKVRSGMNVTREFRVPHSVVALNGDDGQSSVSEPHWYRLCARPLELKGYRKPLIVWEISDVTEDRARQESVFQELQDAVSYLDHAPAGFFSTQADGRIAYLNATLADWLGIDLAQFRPGSYRLRDLVLGDGLALLDAINTNPGQTTTGVVDLDLARADGTSLPARLYHKVPVSPDGAPGETRTLVLNRSSGEGIAEDLRVAELRFTRFFNNTPIAIASLSEDGAITQSNAPFQRLFAHVLKSAGKNAVTVVDLCGDGERDAARAALAAASEGRTQIDFIDSHLPGNEDCSVRYFISAITDGAVAHGEEARETAILYAIEMTEQKALERQMAQGQKMQAVGQLAGGIAHDFNNVLTAIIGFSDLLLSNHRPSDPSFPDIMNIKHSANRAASLVRQLLAFSRRQTLRPQILTVPDSLSDLRMLIARLLGDKVKLEINHGRDLWPLKADIGQFEQVIVNLCVNARDAINDQSGDGGTVTITTRNLTAKDVEKGHSRPEMPAADYVLIEVSDTGTGMTPEVMQKIFEPFFSTKDVGKGTGLGLSTVYGIVKQSGGFIYPVSVLGEGTTFQIYFPRHEPTAAEVSAAAEEGERKEVARDLAGNATIVFVEDEDAVRAVGSRTLQARGYDVHEAENGVEAMELLEDLGDKVDLVVSDVVMPEMDGPTLLQEARKAGYTVRFIFASGYAEEAFEKNLPEAERGKFGFIPKPYSLKQLATAVKEQLDGN
ncbi:cell cycle histidine kinase CckA [Pseudahrensia aquimaris]|uniref:histidine kinase n=1 Tax=Pseudahrensia aquimaris TaxID=744461 RepID=A0ABW3FJ41_9HYPH